MLKYSTRISMLNKIEMKLDYATENSNFISFRLINSEQLAGRNILERINTKQIAVIGVPVLVFRPADAQRDHLHTSSP